MKKSFGFALLLVLSLVFISSCKNKNSSSENSSEISEVESKIVPIYQGVSFTSQEKYEARNSKKKKDTNFDDELIYESIKKDFGILTTEQVSYYSVKGEKAYIT